MNTTSERFSDLFRILVHLPFSELLRAGVSRPNRPGNRRPEAQLFEVIQRGCRCPTGRSDLVTQPGRMGPVLSIIIDRSLDGLDNHFLCDAAGEDQGEPRRRSSIQETGIHKQGQYRIQRLPYQYILHLRQKLPARVHLRFFQPTHAAPVRFAGFASRPSSPRRSARAYWA